MDRFHTFFTDHIPTFRARILEKLGDAQTLSGFRSVWENFEEIIIPVLIDLLRKPPFSIREENIKEATSKSIYPDLEVHFEDKRYAIDIKSAEDKQNPRYDIGRLDTYIENHLDVYENEYCITVRWTNRESIQILDVYVESTYQSVGYDANTQGVKFRLYDGKLRPKLWKHFEEGHAFWKDKEHFRQGILNSQHYRRQMYILKWYREMSPRQRILLQKKLAEIDDNALGSNLD